MNLILNKNLLDNVSSPFDILFQRLHIPTNHTVTIYTDAINSTITEQAAVQHTLFVPESMIKVLDKISSTLWNESIDITANGNQLHILVSTLLNGSEFQRNSALDKLVQMGIILISDTSSIKALASRFTNYNNTTLVKTYEKVDNEQYYQYTYNIPLLLEKTYDKVRNINSEKLYLLYVNYGNSQFANEPVAGTNYGYFTKYWDDLFLKNSLTMSYGAVDIGSILDINASIQYDHLDIIQYFDNIIIQIKVPNNFN